MPNKEMLIAALCAQRLVLQFEIDARSGYSMNRDFQLECSVKRDMIIKIEDRIRYLQGEKNDSI